MVVLVAWLVLCSPDVWAQRRLALVIGNSAYGTENKLANPVNDARLMARTLRDLGFAVELKTDLGKRDMELSIARFTRESSGADSAVLYYAGHGAQLVGGGRNYLLPVDARIDDDDTLQTDGIPADRIVEQLERGPNPAKLRLVILDACRNNSLAGKARSGVRGLARMTPSQDYTLIAFSTNDQDVALDGSGDHSPYTRSLSRHLSRARELPLRRIFELTATDVREQTGNQQRPRTYGDLDSRVMLDGRLLQMAPAPVQDPAAPAAASGDTSLPSDELVELQAWTAVKAANVAAGYRAYLSEYPNGRFVKLARIELARLDAAAPAPRAGEAAAPVPAVGAVRPGAAPTPADPLAGRAGRPDAAAPPIVATAPQALPHSPRAATVSPLASVPGRAFQYRIKDRAYGKTIELTRQVTAVDNERVVYDNGARVEDLEGRLLSAAASGTGDFELIEPPRGWGSLLLPTNGTAAASWTARDGLELAMGAPRERRESVTIEGRTRDAIVIDWEGRARWPGDLFSGANYLVRIQLSLDATTRRVLRLQSQVEAIRSGLAGFRNSSEDAVLVGPP